MVSLLAYESSGLGSSPGRGQVHRPGAQMGTGSLNAGGNLAMD